MIYLASQSIRRKEILKQLALDFQTIKSSFQEILHNDPFFLLKSNACGKAMHTDAPSGLVLGMDTIGVCQGNILEKPIDEEDAFRMLKMLSGNTHQVYTGSCLYFPQTGTFEYYQSETSVTFYTLSEREISLYIETGEPMDKAAAYGIQGKGKIFVKSIQGDYWNVVGFPTEIMRKIQEYSDN